jgi:two-component system, OmpR family, sensor histidine kinase MprB
MTGARPRWVRVRPAGRRWSLRARLGLVSTIAVTVGLGIAGVTAYAVTSRVLYQQIDASLRHAPPSIGPGGPGGPASSVPGGAGLCRLIRSPHGPSPGLYAVALLKRDGTVCTDPKGVSVVVAASDSPTSGNGETIRLRDGSLSDGHAARVAVVATGAGDVLLIARDTQSIRNVLTVLQLTLAGVTVLGAMLALGLSRWTSGAGLRPITKFTRVAEQIAVTGEVDPFVGPEADAGSSGTGDELDRLSAAFSTMTRVLADAQLRQRRLVADAGHELRTPLASLGNNISLLRRSRSLRKPLPADEEGRLLDDLSSQVAELTHLVDDLASLAESDPGRRPFTEVRLDACAERAVRRARSRSLDHRIQVELDPWAVTGDASALERAVVNLLDNALKFSRAGTEVEVSLSDGTLVVADRGRGLVDGEGERAFERFWRSPGARSLPGSGLGLSIVEDIAHQHGGWVTLAPRPGGGAVATLHIPGRSDTPADSSSD